MLSASSTLRASVFGALKHDSALNTILGGARVYDDVPRNPAFPFVTLGEARINGASGDDGETEEHQLTLHAWSRQGGHREAHLIAGAILNVLDDAPLVLDAHRLVNLRFALADVRRENDGRTYHAIIRFRAITEPQ